jgi:hypothetical protein
MSEDLVGGLLNLNVPKQCAHCQPDSVMDDRLVVWFDVDNTLYSASDKISQAMSERIHGPSIHLLCSSLCTPQRCQPIS